MCENIGPSGLKCFRKIPSNSKSKLCEYHSALLDEKTKNTFNEICPICQEGDEDMKPGTMVDIEGENVEVKWYPLSCMHRAHIHCMKGMNKLECPMCRSKIMNLPDSIRLTINSNSEKLKAENLEEQLQADRAFIEDLARQGGTVRPPPQMELLMAMRYIFELGIPPSLIPGGITLEIDPESPLPHPGFIFQNAVANIIEHIQSRVRDITEEDGEDAVFDNDNEDDENSSDDPFELEGDDLRVIHSIQTIPLLPQNRQPGERIRARVDRSVFNTMRFVVSDLPALTEEDLELIDILNGASHDEFID